MVPGELDKIPRAAVRFQRVLDGRYGDIAAADKGEIERIRGLIGSNPAEALTAVNQFIEHLQNRAKAE
jgi:hypothetical protein